MADLVTLLAPIREGAPTGADLRITPGDLTFDKIKSMRTFVQKEEDRDGKGRDPDWKGVARECTEALTHKSKDLELAITLSDAWSRLDGFPGLRDGLRLTAALCDQYWDTVHPGAGSEIDLNVRRRCLNWLAAPVGLSGISAGRLFEGPDPRDSLRSRMFCWEDFRRTSILDERSMGPNKAGVKVLLDQGYISSEEWLARIKAAKPESLALAVAAVEECRTALAELRAIAEKRFGADEAPSLGPAADMLDEIHAHVSAHLPAPKSAEPEAQPAAETAAVTEVPNMQNGILRTRDDALRRLDEVAEFFRKTEPHSPIAHLAARAARWGRMPLEEVLAEVIPDQNVLAKIWDTLGVRPAVK
jgi:type VI secretion system protein ImpA